MTKTNLTRFRTAFVPMIFVATAAGLMLAAGCGPKTEDASGTTAGGTTASATGAAPVAAPGGPAGGVKAPGGNVNANAASDAAAFKAARDKAEGK